MTGPEVLAEIEEQLAWRGPSGKPLGHVVIERAKMERFLAWVEEEMHPVSNGLHQGY
jgi:hypothetical protein